MGLQAMSMEEYSESKVREGEVKDLIVAWCALATELLFTWDSICILAKVYKLIHDFMALVC